MFGVRSGLSLLALIVVVVLPASAFAAGTVRIVQNDGTLQAYPGVAMTMKGDKLWMTSPDQVSTLTIAVRGANCWPENGVVYCADGEMSLHQAGKVTAIPFTAAKFYFNLTDKEQSAGPLAGVFGGVGCEAASSIGPRTVVFAVMTAKGTHITGNGKLD
jgi:hypothetical protein